MKQSQEKRISIELEQLCAYVRTLVIEGNYEACLAPISQALAREPHAPQPHNLMGIVMEKMGDRLTAMKHFRAALALDPTYLPAPHNLNTYGTFYAHGSCAFDESDIPSQSQNSVVVKYDSLGIGHVSFKTKLEYDRHGPGCAARR